MYLPSSTPLLFVAMVAVGYWKMSQTLSSSPRRCSGMNEPKAHVGVRRSHTEGEEGNEMREEDRDAIALYHQERYRIIGWMLVSEVFLFVVDGVFVVLTAVASIFCSSAMMGN